MESGFIERGLRAAASAVRAGLLTPEEVLAAARARAVAVEPQLGAVVSESPRAGKRQGPLAGTVLGIKELVAVAGIARTCGAPAFLGSPPVASTDAWSVRRLLQAGAGLLGTTACDPLAYGVVGAGTRNPLRADLVAGGSSGGSAAAVATGLVHAALGTDTGGSVRIPASCCGTVGVKPRRAAILRQGVAPLAESLDTVGVLASSVEDARLLLRVMSTTGADPGPATLGVPVPLRIGLPRQLSDMPVDPDVRHALQVTLQLLAESGSEVVPVDLPGLGEAGRANGVVLAEEAFRLHGPLLAARGELLPADTRRRLEGAGRVSPGRAAEARRRGAVFAARAREVCRTVDVICTPTLPCPPPHVGAAGVTVEGRDEAVVSAMTRLTGPWNLADLPAGSVPGPVVVGGVPLGIQFAGAGTATVLAALESVEVVVAGGRGRSVG